RLNYFYHVLFTVGRHPAAVLPVVPPMPAALFPTGPRGDLLLLMKRAGAVSLDDAEAATGLARPTLRQHFGVLERDGLVARSTRKQGRGRPSLRYALTPEAEALFPSRDGHLLGRLLAFLQEHGEDERIADFFERYWDERYLDARQRLDRLPEDDAEGRLDALLAILREQGFMPEVRRADGGLVIRECNCPRSEERRVGKKQRTRGT